MQRGMAQLPDLHVSDSSEAMLSGRKPPFRLLVRAVASDGRKVNIRHAVSEGFVVRPSLSSALYTRCHNSVIGMRLHCRSLASAKQMQCLTSRCMAANSLSSPLDGLCVSMHVMNSGHAE